MAFTSIKEACLLFTFVTLLSDVSLAITPQLTILPNGDKLQMPVGHTALVTCRPIADDINLISDMKWYNIYNQPIEPFQPEGSRLYLEHMAPDRSLALIITDLKENDAGKYTCNATYAGSQVLTKSVQIETIESVRWVDAPKEQFPELGKDFKVRCVVAGKPAPRVEWKIHDKPLTAGGRFIAETDGLLIQNVQITDDGIYSCRALVVETGELAVRLIKVEVHIPPEFEKDMVNSLTVVEGESASISCRATGKPEPTYKWIRESTKENLGVSSDRFLVNEKTGILNINRVTRDDNGNFICIASNGAGTVEQLVRVTVIIKPNVLEIRNISVAEGKDALLECRATGNPLPAITFRKLSSSTKLVAGLQPHDDRIVVSQKEDPDKGQSIGFLNINPLETTDDGLYACIASNKGGEAFKNGHVTVEFKPTFERTPMKEAWSWNRRPVNLTCIAESIPNATITWKLNERIIQKDPSFQIYENGPQSTILVTPTDLKFYGNYKCVGRNIHGEAEQLIRLQEAHPPSEIMQAKREVITATTITFSFMGPSSTGGRPIKAYVAQYKLERKTWNESQNKSWPIDSSYIIEGLEPQAVYNFRFAALNDVGLSNWGANQHHTMPKRSFPEEPVILNRPVPPADYVTSQWGDRFDVRWKKPADNGEYIDNYELEHCTVHKENDAWSSAQSGCKTFTIRNTEQTSIVVSDLHPDTFYKLELRAHNAIGYSTPSQIVLRTARVADTSPMFQTPGAHLSSSMLIAVVVAALFLILFIVDVSCFLVNDTGLLWLMCGKKGNRKSRDDETKLGSEGKELLNNGNRDGKIRIDTKPIIDGTKRDTTVEYDMKNSVSRTSFVGKDSAV